MAENTSAAPHHSHLPAWAPWIVVKGSSFRVDDPSGAVGCYQLDRDNFVVTTSFRFDNERVEALLHKQLGQLGMPDDEVHRRVDDARTYLVEHEDPTDVASIPKYLRWFENPYGRHTLAAIIHDRLITNDGPNKGALGSDTLSDRFFREMMADCGVRPFKRWIMWAAVALRSRWAAGGHRRVSVAIWLAMACAGIASFVAAVAGRHPFGVSTAGLLVFALAAPVVSSVLWGRQWGASYIAALAALWILPPTALALVGYAVYLALEHLVGRFGSSSRPAT